MGHDGVGVDVHRQLPLYDRREVESEVHRLPDLLQEPLAQGGDPRHCLLAIRDATALPRCEDHDDRHELRQAPRLERVGPDVDRLAVPGGIADKLEDVGDLDLIQRLPHRDLAREWRRAP